VSTEPERGEGLPEPAAVSVAALTHPLATATLAGFVAGVIAGGIGSRIAMRIVALTAGSADQGAITDAEATVGEITASGTITLLVLGGFIGALGGLTYLALRRWLADAGMWRGLAFAVLLLMLFGSGIIDGANPDFRSFGSTALNVAMFAVLFVGFGLLVAPFFEWFRTFLPRASLHRSGLGASAAYAFGLVLLPPALISVGAAAQENIAVRPLLLYVLAVVPIASALLARSAGRFERLSDLREHRNAMGAACLVLALPVLAGVVLDVRALVDIFESA
jgi:hypothetical protein